MLKIKDFKWLRGHPHHRSQIGAWIGVDGGCFIDRELALNAEDTARVEIDFGDLPRTNRNNQATQNHTKSANGSSRTRRRNPQDHSERILAVAESACGTTREDVCVPAGAPVGLLDGT